MSRSIAHTDAPGLYIRGNYFRVHHRLPLTQSAAEDLRWVISAYGFLATSARRSMAQEWISFQAFADLIAKTYSAENPVNAHAIAALRELGQREQSELLTIARQQ